MVPVCMTPDTPPSHPLGPWLQPARRTIHRALSALPHPVSEFILFGLKMAWACLFGAAMLGLLLFTYLVWPKGAAFARYDFLLIAAIALQGIMLWTRLETFEEVKVIMLYHLIGTVMEVFKTHMGSWEYPEASLIRIGGVPLFTGFMYGTVGSFIARAIRIFDMRFARYPPLWQTWVLAVLIYINFFTHHFVFDARYGLFAVYILVFWKCMIHFRVDKVCYRMPYVLASVLTAFFLWIAENIGTLTKTWVYPSGHDTGWHPVSLHKMGAWLLLLIISFVTVSLVIKPKPPEAKA
jgi:uncharacterized membrane protein YoaT (DUF817 family)